MLTERPELDFVQLAINYMDWDSKMVQAKNCYEVAGSHGKKIIIMEPVKGGALAKLSEAAEQILKAEAPEYSIVSWAFCFLASLEGVITILSGMSELEQVQDNIETMKKITSLTDREKSALDKAVKVYRDSVPVPANMIDQY